MSCHNRKAIIVGYKGGIGSAIYEELSSDHTVTGVGRGMNELVVRPDVLVHAAGTYVYGPITATRAQRWDDLFHDNLFRVVELSRFYLPALREKNGHVIICNSTAVANTPVNRAAYTASKTALLVFARALAQEEADVKVTTLFLGRVATGMQEEVCELEEGSSYDNGIRFLQPKEVAVRVRDIIEQGLAGEIEVRP